MLSNINKTKLVEMAKKVRAAANMLKESLKHKRKAPTLITQTPHRTGWGDHFRVHLQKEEENGYSPTKHFHSDGRVAHQYVAHSDGYAPHQNVIVIQECEAESSKGKGL